MKVSITRDWLRLASSGGCRICRRCPLSSRLGAVTTCLCRHRVCAVVMRLRLTYRLQTWAEGGAWPELVLIGGADEGLVIRDERRLAEGRGGAGACWPWLALIAICDTCPQGLLRCSLFQCSSPPSPHARTLPASDCLHSARPSSPRD